MKAVKIFVLLFSTFFSCPLAQAQLTLNEFLGSSLEDPEVKTYEDQMVYLSGKPYRLPGLRELQFRTQNRELTPTQQEYALRISPSNPWEVQRQNQYFKEMNSTLSFEREIVLKDALMNRYFTAIEYLYYAMLNKLNTEAKARLEQQLAILEKQSGSRYFDAEDYVKLRVDQLDFLVEEEEISFELSNQLSRITRTYPKAHNQRIEWDFNSVISLDKIKVVIDSIEQASVTSSMVAYYEQKVKLAQSEYKLEKSNFNIGFLQTSYDRRRVHQERVPFSISLGVSIPIFNQNKGDMAKSQLDLIEAEYDYKEETYQSESDKMILKEKVFSLIARIENLEKKIQDLRQSDLPRALTTIKDGDPMAVIQFSQRIIKLQALSYKVRRELFIAYVEYLLSTDALQKQPLINFLSPALTPVTD